MRALCVAVATEPIARRGAPGALQSPQQDKRMGFRRPFVIDVNRLELMGALKDPEAVLAVVGWRSARHRTSRV